MEAETEDGVAEGVHRGEVSGVNSPQHSLLWRGRWFLLVFVMMYLSWGPLFTFILLPSYIILFIVGFSWPMINEEDPRTILLVKNTNPSTPNKSYYDYHQIFEKLASFGSVPPHAIDENSLENENRFSPGQRIDTGHLKLDSELNEVLDLVFRDYIYSWYDKMLPQFLSSVNCEHEELFPKSLRNIINHCTCEMVTRLKSANRMHPLVNFFTVDIIEELKNHVGLFRLAEVKVPRAFRAHVNKEATEIRNNEVRAMFFDLEVSQYQEGREQAAAQARCRDFISQNDRDFTDYLRTVVDAIMLVTLPVEEFKSRPVRYAVRELLVTQVLKPTFDNMCSADFLNSCLIRYTPTESGVSVAGSVSSEAFVEMVKCSGSIEELDAIIAFAQEERTNLQTHDNLGNNASTKKQLNSINYLIAECNARIEKLAHPQSNMSALSKMTSIVSSVTALNPLSQLSTSTSFHSMGIEEEDELDSYSHLSQYNLETKAASTSVKGSPARDFAPAVSLTLGQILHSYHDEFFSYLEKLNASKFLQFYDYALAYKSTVDEVNSYRDERMMVNKVAGAAASDQGSSLSQDEEHRVQSNLGTMKHFAEYLLESYIALAEDKQSSVAFNFKLDMTAVKELKQKLANKSLEPGFDWFEKMSKQTYMFIKTHPRLYPGFISSKSYRSLFQTSAVESAAGRSEATPDSPNVGRRESTSSNATLNVNSEPQPQHQQQRALSPSSYPSCGVETDVVAYQISDEGKRHAVYEVQVTSYFADQREDEGKPKTTRIFRRYRDFLKLYEDLCKRYPAVENIKFPPKKASNLEEKVLIKRKEQLDVFLKEMLSPEILSANPGLLKIVYQFLSNDQNVPTFLETFGLTSVRRSKSDRSTRGNRGSWRGADDGSDRSGSSATDALCSLDENREIGSKNRGFIRSYSSRRSSSQSHLMQNSQSDQELAPETMKQLIDLFFELFDVKAGGGGDWNVVRQQLALAISKVLKATFGDRMNRKIVKLVSSYMTEESICGYIANMREMFWPQGYQTMPGEPKSVHEKYRTKFLAKVKLYGSISGEIKSLPFVTQDVTKRGILRFVKLFQDEQLNRRLAVVLFEELLTTIFPDLKFDQIFNEIYQKSDRIRNIHNMEKI